MISRYEISIDGTVTNIRTKRIMKQQVSTGGKVRVGLVCDDGVTRRFSVHRLVAERHIPNPYNKPQVDHIDGDTSNNNVCNLRWCTNIENQEFRYKQGNSGKDSTNKRIMYGDTEFNSISSLAKHISNIRGCKYETARKEIKSLRHGARKLYGKHSYFI